MLYQVFEAQRASLAPAHVAAEALSRIFSHPLVPPAYTPGGRALAAACEQFERMTRRVEKPSFRLAETRIAGERVPVRQVALLERPFCTLLRFEREVRRVDPRVLLVAPLSGHHATLLRGTVEALLPDHDVTITDWTDSRLVPLARGPFGLADNIDQVIEALRLVGPGAHVVAVCQPAPVVLAAVARMAMASDPAQPRSMTLMGGPVDARVHPTEVDRFAATHSLAWFEHTVVERVPACYPGAFRRVYPGFLQLGGFMAMNRDRHVDAHFGPFERLVSGDGTGAAAHRRFDDEYLAVMDLPAEFYLDTIRIVFQEHALPRGMLVHRGERIEPAAIRKTALMTVEGERDRISGLGQTEAAHALCSNIPAERRDHMIALGVGHFGIFNGRRWRDTICPRVRDFIGRNNARS